MKKNIILTILVSLMLSITISNAAPVGSAFSYQGELLDNGSPANGLYDIGIEAFDKETGNNNFGISQFFLETPVVNGKFTIPEVDFGDAVFDGDDIWLRILVKPAGDPTFTQLTPRQRLNAVPYAVQAEFLAANGASNNDVLQFDGSNWVAAAASGLSPWNEAGGNINYTAGRIGIGTTAPTHDLHIQTDSGENPLRIRIGVGTKFKVEANGSTTIGTNFVGTPDNGLYVHGDVKQTESAKGMMKYMFRARCDTTPQIVREYNGTNIAGSAGITYNSAGNCTITLPINLNDNFLSVSTVWAGGGARLTTCANLFSGMVCTVVDEDGNGVNGRDFDVLIY